MTALIVLFKGWEDLVKLSNDFPQMFGTLLTDFEINIEKWKEVKHNHLSTYLK